MLRRDEKKMKMGKEQLSLDQAQKNQEKAVTARKRAEARGVRIFIFDL